MNSIGERLRQERLRQGFSLQQIADLTKINIALLEAIEADDLEKLPGIFFTRSFVRQYATALGLEEADYEPELDRLAGCEEVPTLEDRPTSREDFDVPPVVPGQSASLKQSLASLAAFLLIMAACSAIYLLWQRARESKPTASTPAVSAPVRQRSEAKPSAAAMDSDKPAAKPAVAPAPPAQPTPAQPLPEASSPQTAAPQTPATSQPPPVLSTVAPGQPAPLHVQIRAVQAVWIRVAADGRYLFSGTLQPNQTRTVEGNQLVQLRAGNAAGVEVLWNGKSVGSIGSEGQVRNIDFTPQGFKVLAAPPPKPAQPDDGL